jgi:hypothetical protein
MPTGTKPTFFVIGAPKSGTSSLCYYLSRHPNVFFSVPKEPGFWCTEDVLVLRKSAVTTLNGYLRLFARVREEHIAVGEGSTCYLSSARAVSRINDFNPQARFIIMLRDPVEMVRSLHQENLFNFDEDIQDFEEAWQTQDARRNGILVPRGCSAERFLQYGDMGKYAIQVERCLSIIGHQRLMVILFDDFVAQTDDVYRAVLEFLGLPHDGRTSFPWLRETQTHRCKMIGRLLLKPPKTLATPVAWIRRAAERNENSIAGMASKWFRSKQTKPSLRADFENELRRYFLPDIEYLERLISRDLSCWKPKMAQLEQVAGS